MTDTTRDQYDDKLKAQLDRFNAEVDRLEAEAKLHKVEARAEYYNLVESLRTKRQKAEDR